MSRMTAPRLGLFLLLGMGLGCAHQRPSYEPGAASRGVHVRAPFVNVHVNNPRRAHQEPTLSRIEDQDERKVSRGFDDEEERD